VELTNVVRDRVDTWTALADQAGVRLRAELPAYPAEVTAVPGGVEQMLDNLLDSALNASPRGSTVTVRVGPSAGADRWALVVVDQGPGLSDEQKVLALQRFWRGGTATPGTGLGLPIVEALAVASGGALELRDGPAGGLEVVVELPASR
jgi:signal transduction histidine kinase